MMSMISSASGLFSGLGGPVAPVTTGGSIRAPVAVSGGVTMAPVTTGVVGAPAYGGSARFSSITPRAIAAPIVASTYCGSARFAAAPVATAMVSAPVSTYAPQPVLTGNVGTSRPISREELKATGRLTEEAPVDAGYAPTWGSANIAAPIVAPTYGGSARFGSIAPTAIAAPIVAPTYGGSARFSSIAPKAIA